MRTRDGHRLEVVADATPAPGEHGLEVRSGPGDDGPGSPPSPRRALGLVLAGLLVLATAASLVLVLTGDDDDGVVARSSQPGAAQAAGPRALGLTVDLLTPAVAGEPARLSVSWADGSGVFSGSSEDWGDAVGTSSRKQGRCEPGAAAAPAAAGKYALKHTWSEPGTYSVVIGVATYTCADGSAVEEEASTTLTVEVRPAG